MAQALATVQEAPGAIMESVIVKGDLAKLTPEERTRYYMEVCRSIGLNPLTKPFEYITLNGKLTLYARRDAADQLRKINNISVEIVDRSIADDLITVHVRARDAAGRTDEDMGVVTIGSLKGEARANAILKAITKAKRRVTLSISGLGFLDETEIEDIPASAKAPPPVAAAAITPPKAEPPHNPETGEVAPHAIPFPGNFVQWGGKLVAAVKADGVRVDEWVLLNNERLYECQENAPKVYERIMANVEEMRAQFAPPAEGEILTADDAPTVLSAG